MNTGRTGPDRGLADPVARQAEGRPDQVALATSAGVSSYIELDAAVEALAARLPDAGVGPGTIVALLRDATEGAVVAMHAIWRVGGTVLPLHTAWTESEVAHAIDEAHEVEPLPEGTAALIRTSGTSGKTGMVAISHANLRASAAAAAARLDLGPGDLWYASLSPAHVGGLALIHRAAWLGAGVWADGPFELDTLVRLIREQRITHASLVPTMLRRLLEVWEGPVPRTLCSLLIGGAGAPEALLSRALEAGLPIALTYGLTEATSQVATAPPGLVRRKPGTVGPPLDGVEVQLTEQGEILVRGAILALVPGPADDGWLHTGDLGHLDEEGHLWITGRLSARIVSGGVTVDPAEVEGVLRDHPAVADAVVVGLPDPEWGERVVAALVLEEGEALLSPTELSAALDPFVRARLSPPKRPRTYLSLDDLPLSPNGKVDRGAVRRAFGPRGPAAEPPSS